MSAAPLDRRQSRHRGWRRIGSSLVRELAFRDFEQALDFVERVGSDAEDHLNRPDMCICDFNRVRLTITNRNHAGVTQAELRLAAKVSAIIDERPGAETLAAGTGPPDIAAAQRLDQRPG
jgi:pterin-4a-carbinolamine dehydratase